MNRADTLIKKLSDLKWFRNNMGKKVFIRRTPSFKIVCPHFTYVEIDIRSEHARLLINREIRSIKRELEILGVTDYE